MVSGPFALGPATASKARREGMATFVGRGPNGPSHGMSSGAGVGGHSFGGAHGSAGPKSWNFPHGGMPSSSDAGLDMSVYLARRDDPSLHLPVSLEGLNEAIGIVKLKDENGNLRDIIEQDDPLRDSQMEDGAELFESGRLVLIQLPLGLLEAIRPQADSKGPTEPSGPSSLLAGKEGEQAEKTIDLETHNKAREAREAEEAAKRSARLWPTAAEGRYGKLRVYKSGRVTMLVNGLELEASPSAVSADISGMQRIVAIDSDYGQSFDLGSVDRQLVFAPKLDDALIGTLPSFESIT